MVLIVSRKKLQRSRESLIGHTGCADTLSGIMNLLYQLVWFPVIIFISILPESLYDIIEAVGGTGDGFDLTNNATFVYISHVTPILSGIFMSLAFVLTNSDANAEVRSLMGLAPMTADKFPLAGTGRSEKDPAHISNSSSSRSTSSVGSISMNSRTDTIASSTVDEV